MNDFHKTFVLAFYDSFLKIELYFDKESMGQVLKKGGIGIIPGDKTILVFSDTYMPIPAFQAWGTLWTGGHRAQQGGF